MPRSRSSAEERILQFFRESSLEVAQVVLNLAKSEVKARLEDVESPEPAKKRKRRKQQKPATVAEPQPVE